MFKPTNIYYILDFLLMFMLEKKTYLLIEPYFNTPPNATINIAKVIRYFSIVKFYLNSSNSSKYIGLILF